MNPFVILGTDGKPTFVGSEDKHNPPVTQKMNEQSKVTCPQCQAQVDYLLGDVKQGCESCYRPELDKKDESNEVYDESKRVL
jgi:protein-arginine kinase activator protein McsA